MSLCGHAASDPARRRDLATIHVAKKQLGMDDETYRSMLWSVGRVKSAADLDFAGRMAVLAHLKACGFHHRRPQSRDPQSRKIRALWLDLKGLGAIRNASEGALASYVERVTGVKALQWLNTDQASEVIEQLKAWGRRVRRDQLQAANKEAGCLS